MLPFSRSALLLFCASAFFSPACLAAPDADHWRNLIAQQQQREQARQESLRKEQHLLLESPPLASSPMAQVPDPGRCFPIRRIVLRGEQAQRFRFALRAARREMSFQAGECLDAKRIDKLLTSTQNALIAKGYTTTRILIAPQNLHSGELLLTVLPGTLHALRFTQEKQDRWHVHGTPSSFNTFPTKAGDVLDLRDLEQGLENLRRVPTVAARIRMVPAAAANESDVLIAWSQRVPPYRVSFHFDDSGSEATGKYLAGITLSADNPLGLSDLFYLSLQRDVGGKKSKLREASGARQESNTRSHGIHYSVPWGNWLFSVDLNRYRYHQAVAGYSQNYDYHGRNTTRKITLQRLLYRDAHRKTYLRGGFWTRSSRRYIDDTELDVQKSRTAGWVLGLHHKEYLAASTWDFRFTYKRGTGMLGSLPAPGEAFGEASGRMRVLTADLGVYLPFSIAGQPFNYDGTLHMQWHGTPLMSQDQLAIGGRYSVRGFDGERSLIAEKGWYLRNTLGWEYRHGQQLYLGVDVGRVSGPSSAYLLGKRLAGGVLGIKGQIKAGGTFSYDLFAGKAFSKPDGFASDEPTLGFKLDYSF